MQRSVIGVLHKAKETRFQKFKEILDRKDIHKRVVVDELRSGEKYQGRGGYAGLVVLNGEIEEVDEILRGNPGVSFMQVSSTGVDRYLASSTVRDHPLHIYNLPDVYKDSLAEFVFFGFLHFAKLFPVLSKQMRAGEWPRPFLHDLKQKKLCVIGCGSIGMAIARMGHAFGMDVVGVSHHGPKGEKDPILSAHYNHQEAGRGFADSDYIALALPGDTTTRGVIDRAYMEQFPKGVVLANVGRGYTVKTGDLVSLLEERHLSAAVLDVVDPEPLPADHPLRHMENVLLYPHVADHTVGSEERAMESLVNRLLDLVDGSASFSSYPKVRYT